MVDNMIVVFIWNTFTYFEWIQDRSRRAVVICTVKATLVRCCTRTQILIPIRIVWVALIRTCSVMNIWWAVLMWIIECSSYAIFSPSVIKDWIVFLLRDAEIVVVFYLVEWVELGLWPSTFRLEATGECEETGTGLPIPPILKLMIVR